MKRKRIAVVMPTSWDARQLEACRASWEDRYEVLFEALNDADCPADLDILAYIGEVTDRLRARVDGVLSSSDYPGASIAAAVSTRLGLPGTAPQIVMRCSHKYASRLVQREAVPDATPAFDVVDARSPAAKVPSTGFPCFVKPVKGAFSMWARRVDSMEELVEFLSQPGVQEFASGYMKIFNRMVAGLTDLAHDGHGFICEGLITGHQVTVEGYATDHEITIVGISDSLKHVNGSFSRFEYPSALPEAVQGRMASVAVRAMRSLGLRWSMFNIEMAWDPDSDAVRIIEINPRICGQFGDLYQKVHGVNGYEIALALAAGDLPPSPGTGRHEVAASVPLRIFQPSRVLRAPLPAEVTEIEARFEGTLVWNECQTGQFLVDFALEDGASYRYAVMNLGAANRTSLLVRAATLELALDYQFEPIT